MDKQEDFVPGFHQSHECDPTRDLYETVKNIPVQWIAYQRDYK